MSEQTREPRRGFQRPGWLTQQGVFWLLRISPALVLLLVFAIKALSMVGVNGAGMRAYDQANYATSRASFVQLGFLNLFQPWIAPYNRGTAEYQLRDYDAARDSFTLALGRAPQQYDCRVRLNLVASIEGQADVLAGQQQHAKAAERYQEGLRILAEGDCGEPPGDTPSPGPSDSPSPSQSPSPTDSPSPSDTGSPTSGPTDGPTTQEPSGEPSPGSTGDPTDGPGDEEDEGEQSGQSEEERRREEAERKQEQEERMEQKAEEQREQAERQRDDPDQEDDQSDDAPDEPNDPSGAEQRQQQLEEQQKTAQQKQHESRDREGRPDQRSDTPW